MSLNVLNDIEMLIKTVREEIKGLHQELEELRIREDPKEMTDNATESRNGLNIAKNNNNNEKQQAI